MLGFTVVWVGVDGVVTGIGVGAEAGVGVDRDSVVSCVEMESVHPSSSTDVCGFFEGVIKSARPLQRLTHFSSIVVIKLGIDIVELGFDR
jgi:hypothetical protein